ncbi:MAG TPA: LuxR C-terminal-related transcriptional regulator [Candidatus Limnocylindrales bacterium]|nr:LuxR C-terminal-related transcriptional regulator [Candidatus Limnocylindrales bacterium]
MWDLLGLNDSDQMVYRFILRRPGATPQEVARATALDAAAVSASRGRLLACGLLRRDLHEEIRPNPTGPTAVAERLRERLEAEHNRRRRQVSRFQAEMTRWLNDQILTVPVGQPQVERLPSVEAAIVRTKELLVNSRTEVARCQADPDLAARGKSQVAIPGEVQARRRGVDVRVIYPPAQLSVPRVRRAVDGEIQAGLAVRVAATPETNMIIVDRSAAVVFDHRQLAEIRTFFIRESILIRVLQDLFEIGWTQADDASSFLHDQVDSGGVAADERLLLELLGEGLKDEAVAKRLSVSVRTVRRKICELQRRLGAQSRFQAGLLAARRRWV